MDLFLKHLEALDITPEESTIYLNAIETNASTVLEFAQNTAIPRTTVYLLVESLMKKGLLREEVVGKRKQYVPASPTELISLAKQKEALFKEADVFVFPTIYEGFGLPILEAQSVGVPVITSNRSSMPEVAGKGALLVNPQDEKTIARTMHMLVAEQETRKKMVHKGRKNIERFSWKKCAKEIADVVKKG